LTFGAPARADPVFAYIDAVQAPHQRFNQLLTQAAGYALLVVTRGKAGALLDAPVTIARDALGDARDDLRAVRVPSGARHHHFHLSAAATAIERSLDLLTICLRPAADDHARAALTQALRAATDHLRATTRLLPGFEMVDLSQACCAAHAPAPPICRPAARPSRHGRGMSTDG
jgi:hypothetical protein